MYKVQGVYKPILLLIDIIGSVLFFWKRMIPIKMNKINKVLVIRLDHMGDVLLSTPAIKALKNRMPRARIDMLIRPFTKELVETNKIINKIHTLNPPWFNRESASFANLAKFIIRNLWKYDLVVELHADPKNILLASLVGNKVIGCNIRGFGFLLSKCAEYKNDSHILEKNLDVVRTIGANSEANIELFLTKKDKEFASTIFKRNRIKNAFCIAPGTGRINKFWFNDRWAKLADYLIRRHKIKIIFLGGKEDIVRVSEIAQQMKHRQYIDLTGKTTLRESAAVIRKSKLLVSPDTGAMHMAKAFKVPLVALFGPVNPDIWGYNDKNSRSIYGRQNCSFCDLSKCYNKTNKNACMAAISVLEVTNAIEEVI